MTEKPKDYRQFYRLWRMANLDREITPEEETTLRQLAQASERDETRPDYFETFLDEYNENHREIQSRFSAIEKELGISRPAVRTANLKMIRIQESGKGQN